MNKLLKHNISKINQYCQEYDVERLYAFGSVTTNNFSDDSDIDLLIKFREITYEKYADNYFKLHEIFEHFFNRKVDLLTENSLYNPYFIKKINQTKILLYGA